MGFFDDILSEVRVFTDEIQDLKQELVSSVLDPSGQLRDTVNEITSELTGTSAPSSEVASDVTKTE